MKTFLISMMMIFSLAAGAQDLTCEVSHIQSGHYENVNDFSFQDYRHLLVQGSGERLSVTVGAMVYERDDYGDLPAPILIEESASKTVWATPEVLVDYNKAAETARVL